MNAIRVQKEMKKEWARPGRVFNRNITRGGYSRSSLPGVTQEFRVVKDNRIKLKEVSETLPEASQNGDSSNECAFSNVRDKCSTKKLAAQHHLVTCNVNGHGAAHADNGIKIAAQAHDKEVKPSIVRKMEQYEGTQASLVGSHAVLGKGNQNTVDTAASGKNNFGGELCCSSSDPIHVPSPGSKSAGTFGAIKREVGVVGARQRPADSAAIYTSTSNGLVKVVSAPKVSPHLEWKPKSVSPSTAAPPGAPSPVDDGSKTEVSALSKKLSHANVSHEHVIIPEHIRIPDSERTHFIFGSFESEIYPKASLAAYYDAVAKEDLNDHSPSSPLPQSEPAVSVSEHEQSLTECVDVRSPGVVGGTNETISSKVTHSQPRLQHQEAAQNFKAYEPDSGYGMSFITKVDGEAAQGYGFTFCKWLSVTCIYSNSTTSAPDVFSTIPSTSVSKLFAISACFLTTVWVSNGCSKLFKQPCISSVATCQQLSGNAKWSLTTSCQWHEIWIKPSV
uniref:Uncharacterized protein n=1 Tax=Zea mays TaxID=4577 RepID=A0A804LLP9_MAIZE